MRANSRSCEVFGDEDAFQEASMAKAQHGGGGQAAPGRRTARERCPTPLSGPNRAEFGLGERNVRKGRNRAADHEQRFFVLTAIGTPRQVDLDFAPFGLIRSVVEPLLNCIQPTAAIAFRVSVRSDHGQTPAPINSRRSRSRARCRTTLSVPSGTSSTSAISS